MEPIGTITVQIRGIELQAVLRSNGTWWFALKGLRDQLNLQFSFEAIPASPSLGTPGHYHIGLALEFLRQYGPAEAHLTPVPPATPGRIY